MSEKVERQDAQGFQSVSSTCVFMKSVHVCVTPSGEL